WARGDLAAAYTLARALPAADRATTLAWYARLDPEPASPRAARAAEEALRATAGTLDLLPVIATVPLEHPDVARLADRLAEGSAKRALDLRLDRAKCDFDEQYISSADGVLLALAAEQAARKGERDKAVQRLASLLGVSYLSEHHAQATIH